MTPRSLITSFSTTSLIAPSVLRMDRNQLLRATSIGVAIQETQCCCMARLLLFTCAKTLVPERAGSHPQNVSSNV